MLRQIIKIEEEKCNGCGLCAEACHEEAIIIQDGKARLIRDDYCDGLGNCLPACPTNAITFEMREALEFDEVAVKLNMEAKKQQTDQQSNPVKQEKEEEIREKNTKSRLEHWPVQIKLVPVAAPYLENARLLIAADCTAYAFPDFHERFMKNHITLIGCPKLDEGDYSEKLKEIIMRNHLKSVTIVRMEVPCCGGIEYAFKKALKESGEIIPWQVITLSLDGKIIEE